ncbi:MAG: 50S ribosomal protein L6 [Inquilinus sp.]|nr:50S ribosomal protein L6 [Inquilinus sp.]
MSRIAKHPVTVPAGVQVNIQGQKVTAKGKLGELSLQLTDDIAVAQEDDRITVTPRSNSRHARNMWATSRTLINNLVTGVEGGFTRDLEISGVGYRAAVQGQDLVLQLGYSHEVRYAIPAGIQIKCARPTAVTISGADKQRVGQVAAEIRAFRKPEPFKGKGVKYAEERILRKEGKKK